MPTRLTIDLAALADNYQTLVCDADPAEVAPVVKADGYGLGVGPVAKRLLKEGAKSFFVARASEGRTLRKEIGSGPRIYVLDGLLPGTQTIIRDAGLTPVVNSVAQAKERGRNHCALHIDTGMNRLGVSVAEARSLAAEGFRPELVMSHLGRGEDRTATRNTEQLAHFLYARSAFPHAKASLS